MPESEKDTFAKLKENFQIQYRSNPATSYGDMASVVNEKQLVSESVEIFVAYVSKLAEEASATEEQLNFSLINGFKPTIRQHVLTPQVAYAKRVFKNTYPHMTIMLWLPAYFFSGLLFHFSGAGESKDWRLDNNYSDFCFKYSYY